MLSIKTRPSDFSQFRIFKEVIICAIPKQSNEYRSVTFPVSRLRYFLVAFSPKICLEYVGYLKILTFHIKLSSFLDIHLSLAGIVPRRTTSVCEFLDGISNVSGLQIGDLRLRIKTWIWKAEVGKVLKWRLT